MLDLNGHEHSRNDAQDTSRACVTFLVAVAIPDIRAIPYMWLRKFGSEASRQLTA